MEKLESRPLRLSEMVFTKYFRKQTPPTFKDNEKFTDIYFPPIVESLLSKEYRNKELRKEQLEFANEEIKPDQIEWKRVSDVFGEEKIDVFQDIIEIRDIKQGNLSDCYFLSSLAALTEFPDYIFSKFITKAPNKNCYYEMLLFIDGEWQRIFVDDYFPFKKHTNELAFTQINGTELWTILLEKAWAKANGGYSNIVLGLASEAFLGLTGFPMTYYANIEKISRKELWDAIKAADDTNFIMCTGTKNENFVKEFNLVQGHAYSLVSAREKDESGHIIQLLKLFNPWGRKEWNGSWSDDSALWNDELADYFGKKSLDDGTFFIDINDYPIYFEALFICHMMYGAKLTSYYINSEWSNKPLIFNFQLMEDSKVCLSVFFKNYRFNRELININRPFSCVLVKYNEKKEVISFDGDFTLKEDIQIIKNISKGNYAVWLYCAGTDLKLEPEFEYIFRIACEQELTCRFVGEDYDFKVIKYYLISNRKREMAMKSSVVRKDLVFDYDTSVKKTGLLAHIGINNFRKAYDVTISINQSQNYKMLQNDKFDTTLFPGDDICIAVILTSKTDETLKFNNKKTVSQKVSNGKFDTSSLDNYFLTKIIENNPYFNTMIYSFPNAEELQIIRKFRKEGQQKVETFTIENLIADNKFATEKLLKLLKKNHKDVNMLKLVILDEPTGRYLGIDQKSCELNSIYYGIRIFEVSKEVYIGGFQHGKFEGKGEIYKDEELIFRGNFKGGFKNGKGYENKNGEVINGIYERGKVKGLCKIYNPFCNKLKFCIFENGVITNYALEVEYTKFNTIINKILYYKNGILINEITIENIDYRILDDQYIENGNYGDFISLCEEAFPNAQLMNSVDALKNQLLSNINLRGSYKQAVDLWNNLNFGLDILKIEDKELSKTILIDGITTNKYKYIFEILKEREVIIYRTVNNDNYLHIYNLDNSILFEGIYHNCKNIILRGKLYLKNGDHIYFVNEGLKKDVTVMKAFLFIKEKGIYFGDFSWNTFNFKGNCTFFRKKDNSIYPLNFKEDGTIELDSKNRLTKHEVEEYHLTNKVSRAYSRDSIKHLISRFYPYLYALPPSSNTTTFFKVDKDRYRDDLAVYVSEEKVMIYNSIKEDYIVHWKKISERRNIGAMINKMPPFIFECYGEGELGGLTYTGKCILYQNNTEKHAIFNNKKKSDGLGYIVKRDEEVTCQCFVYKENFVCQEVFGIVTEDNFNLNNEKSKLYQTYGNEHGLELALLFLLEFENNPGLRFDSIFMLNGLYIGQVDYLGYPHGNGIIIFNNRYIEEGSYIGLWKAGLRHGNGIHLNKKHKNYYLCECKFDEPVSSIDFDLFKNYLNNYDYNEIKFGQSDDSYLDPLIFEDSSIYTPSELGEIRSKFSYLAEIMQYVETNYIL